MAFDFPSSPNNGETHEINGKIYEYSSVSDTWDIKESVSSTNLTFFKPQDKNDILNGDFQAEVAGSNWEIVGATHNSGDGYTLTATDYLEIRASVVPDTPYTITTISHNALPNAFVKVGTLQDSDDVHLGDNSGSITFTPTTQKVWIKIYRDSEDCGLSSAIMNGKVKELFQVEFAQGDGLRFLADDGNYKKYQTVLDRFAKRVSEHTGSDGSTSSDDLSKFTTSGSYSWSENDIGKKIEITGSLNGNDDMYTIVSFFNVNSVVVSPALHAEETSMDYEIQREREIILGDSSPSKFFTGSGFYRYITAFFNKTLSDINISGGAVNQYFFDPLTNTIALSNASAYATDLDAHIVAGDMIEINGVEREVVSVDYNFSSSDDRIVIDDTSGLIPNSWTSATIKNAIFSQVNYGDFTDINVSGDIIRSTTDSGFLKGTTSTTHTNPIFVASETTLSSTSVGDMKGVGYAHTDASFISTTSGTGEGLYVADGGGTPKIFLNGTTGVMQGEATSAQFADLAEKYTADDDYEPGTVMEIGGTEEVTLYSGGPLAGVVSTDPGFMLNSELEGGVYIALKGRVPCKVQGSVKKGQYVIAFDSGNGCSSDEYLPGRTIGVALSDSVDGMVEVKI
jgi:hypothetical protein